jgi:hypothetical protein
MKQARAGLESPAQVYSFITVETFARIARIALSAASAT